MDNIGHGLGMGFGIWCAFILFGIILFYFLKGTYYKEDNSTSIQDILDQRYANGEIDAQEYKEKSNVLRML